MDRQIRVDQGSAEYDRYVTDLLTQFGVDDESQITIDFDPVKDRVQLHRVIIERGSAVIDELPRAKIQVLQRERGLESGVLDGQLTLHLLLTDVRVGDRIDYSFTVYHRDAAWGDRYFARHLTQWTSPVSVSRLRILTRESAVLFMRNTGKVAPTRTVSGAWRSLEWIWHDVAGVRKDKRIPSWFESLDAVEFSQFDGWRAVADAARPLFTFESPDPAVDKIVRRLQPTTSSEEDKAVAALRFVQDEIRYTGLELGEGAYRPTPTATVLARRYGDCKDKALLTVALLRSFGIDAVPALVSTRWTHHLAEHLPGPGMMDHAIVRAIIHGRTYWLDATASAQGGSLEATTQADFGFALPIGPGLGSLEAMPRPSVPRPSTSSEVTIDLRHGIGSGTITCSFIRSGTRTCAGWRCPGYATICGRTGS